MHLKLIFNHCLLIIIDFLFLTSFTANKGLYDYLHLVAALSKKFEYARFAMGGDRFYKFTFDSRAFNNHINLGI